MTAPSREEAVRLLLSLDPPVWHLRHSRVVGEVAGWLARRIALANPSLQLDRGRTEAAALLHDVDKALPATERHGLRHGAAGAAWLTAHGHPELAEPVAVHPVTALATEAGAAAMRAASLEARIVAYADKRGRQEMVSMEARFARWTQGHPNGWSPTVVVKTWQRAVALEAEICGLAGCRPAEVRRLAWVGPVLARVGTRDRPS